MKIAFVFIIIITIEAKNGYRVRNEKLLEEFMSLLNTLADVLEKLFKKVAQSKNKQNEGYHDTSPIFSSLNTINSTEEDIEPEDSSSFQEEYPTNETTKTNFTGSENITQEILDTFDVASVKSKEDSTGYSDKVNSNEKSNSQIPSKLDDNLIQMSDDSFTTTGYKYTTNTEEIMTLIGTTSEESKDNESLSNSSDSKEATTEEHKVVPEIELDTTNEIHESSTSVITNDSKITKPLVNEAPLVEDLVTESSTLYKNATASTNREIIANGSQTKGVNFVPSSNNTICPNCSGSTIWTSEEAIIDIFNELDDILMTYDIREVTNNRLKKVVNYITDLLEHCDENPTAVLELQKNGLNTRSIKTIIKEVKMVLQLLREMRSSASETNFLDLSDQKIIIFISIIVVMGAFVVIMLVCLLVINQKFEVINSILNTWQGEKRRERPKGILTSHEDQIDTELQERCCSNGDDIRQPYFTRESARLSTSIPPTEYFEDQEYNKSSLSRRWENPLIHDGRSFAHHRGSNSFTPKIPVEDYSPQMKGILRRYDPITLSPENGPYNRY